MRARRRQRLPRLHHHLTGIDLREQATGSGDICRRILETVPEWFGLDDANADYIKTAEAHPTLIASIDGVDVGLLTIKRHFPHAAEVYLMAVLPEHHRHGIGRAMLRHVEQRSPLKASSSSR